MPSDHAPDLYAPSSSGTLAFRLAHGILADPRAARVAVETAAHELAGTDGQTDPLRLLERVRALAGERVSMCGPDSLPAPASRIDAPDPIDLPFDPIDVADAYASLPRDEQDLLWETLLCRKGGETDRNDLAAAISRFARAMAERSLPSDEDIPSNEGLP